MSSCPIRRAPALAAAICLALAARVSGQLVVDPPAVDFGRHGQNERPEKTILLRNSGGSPMVIQELQRSCDCLTVSPAMREYPIPPGGSVPVRISMGSGRAMGRLEKHLTILVRSPARREIQVPVSMRVLEEYDLSPHTVSLQGVVGGPVVTSVLEVKLRPPFRGPNGPGPVKLEVKGFRPQFQRLSDRFLKARVEPIAGGQRIIIELSPEHPEGLIAAELEASINGQGLFVPVSGDMFAWIKVSPSSVNFSRASESDPASTLREVLLESTDGTPFRILEMRFEPSRKTERGARFELKSEPESAAVSQRITIRAIRGEVEESSFFGTITVKTSHPKKPEVAFKYLGFFQTIKKDGSGK